MTDFELKGQEHKVPRSNLVPIGGKLPYHLEVQTNKLLDLLTATYPNSELRRPEFRKKVNDWLSVRIRPGFYFEFNPNLHLAYGDQRDGPGTKHWWRLFFDDKFRQRVETATKVSALTVTGKTARPNDNQSTPSGLPSKEWNGMYFRSETEICIAEELYHRGVLFFVNARGSINTDNSPISAKNSAGRLEVDFLVFHKGKCISLEVDGEHHNENGQVKRDYSRDRLLLSEGIPTARFIASECYEHTKAVIEEFLNMF